MPIGEMRDVIDAFLHNFTFTGISGVQQALNLDGGGEHLHRLDEEWEVEGAGVRGVRKAEGGC